MSKQYKGKTCAYCAEDGASQTADHVLAREFVQVEHRSQIPKVPACIACNNKKSALETYLAALLPFGGRHAESIHNLATNVPKRLAANQKLHRELAQQQGRIWSREPSGLLVRTMILPLDGDRLHELVGMIARGLMFYHWNVALGPGTVVEVYSLTAREDAQFAQYTAMPAKRRAVNNIGNGALAYEGAQGIDNDVVSFWRLSLYGGIMTTGADAKEASSSFGILTGPKSVQDHAERRLAERSFIIRP
jgi:hypothetical protein